MTLKEYLSQANALNAVINAKLQLLDELRERAATTKSFLACNSGGVRKSMVEELIEKIMVLEESITAEIDGYVDKKAEISAFISLIGDYTLRAIMLNRYINGKTWDEISEDTFISLRNLQYLQNRAFKELSAYYNGGITA